MGGSTRDVINAAGDAKYGADAKFKQFKREQLDEQTRAAQHNAGQASGAAFDSFEMGMEGIGEFVERNTRSLMPQDDGGDDTGASDTVSANYSKSSSEKSSQSKSKAKKKGGEGTGGSKSQFYAKK